MLALTFHDLDLYSADLRGVNLRNADLCGADLCGADLRGVILRNAGLYGADLTCADLTGADLTNADLRSANLTNVNLTNVNLTEATFGGDVLSHCFTSVRRMAGDFVFNALALRGGGYKVSAGCRWLSDTEYRAHVAKHYPGAPKAKETLAILDFIRLRAEQTGV